MSEHELLSLYDAARPLASRHGSRPCTRGGKSRDDDDGLDHSMQGNSGSKYRYADGEMATHADSSTAAAINIYGKTAHPPRTPQRTKALATPNRSKRTPAGDDENNPSGEINGASNSDRASKTTAADKKPQTPPATASSDRALSRLAQQGRQNRVPGTPAPKTPTSQAKRTAVSSSTSGSAYRSPAAASSDRQGASKSTSRGGSRTPTQTKRVTGNISAASLLYQINQPTAPACTYTGAAAPAQQAPESPSGGLSGMAPSGDTSVSSDSPAWRHQARLVGTAGSPMQKEPPRANSREYLSGQLQREKAAKKKGEAPTPKTAGQAQRKTASMAPPNDDGEAPSESPQGGGYVNMSLQDYMASLLTTPAESNTNNGLGSTCESWGELNAQPESDDDDMIMPPDYNESSDSEDEVAEESAAPRPSRPSVTFSGPPALPKGGAPEGTGSHQATRLGGSNTSPKKNQMTSFTNETPAAGNAYDLRPAAGNAYDLRPATEGGSRSAAGGVESSSTAGDTKQVDLAEMSGALFSPKDAQPRAQAVDRRMLKVGEQTLRVSSAHARAEGVATDLERPPSRQKPPPEALHLFAETGMGNIASNLGQNYAPTMDRPMTTMNSQSRSRSARAELGPTAKEAVASASTLSRPPSRQRPPPESLCLEFPPADDEVYREIFHDSSDEEEAA